MKPKPSMRHHFKHILALFFLFAVVSCSPPIDLTTSWTNKQATIKKSPKIMVLAFSQDLANRQAVEGYLANEIKLAGFQAVGSLEVMNPSIQKYDSVALVNLLRQN